MPAGWVESQRVYCEAVQAAQSAIISNAHRVNRGLSPEFPRAKEEKPSSDFYFFDAEEPGKAVETVLRLVREAIPRKFGFKPTDIQVLTPMQRGELGARNLNQVLQAALNPAGPSVQRFGWTFRAGDRVMQTVNDYDKDVFNGDIGLVSALFPACMLCATRPEAAWRRRSWRFRVSPASG